MNPIADYEHNCRLQITRDCLVFSDGHVFAFANGARLREAFEVKHFPPGVAAAALPAMKHFLAKFGDSNMKSIMLAGWVSQPSQSMTYSTEVFDYGVAMDTYLARMADATGTTKQLEIQGISILDGLTHATEFADSAEWGNYWACRVKEQATAVEALIGVVYLESGFCHITTSEVMRRLGVYWPSNSEQFCTLEKILKQLREEGVIGRRA